MDRSHGRIRGGRGAREAGRDGVHRLGTDHWTGGCGGAKGVVVRTPPGVPAVGAGAGVSGTRHGATGSGGSSTRPAARRTRPARRPASPARTWYRGAATPPDPRPHGRSAAARGTVGTTGRPGPPHPRAAIGHTTSPGFAAPPRLGSHVTDRPAPSDALTQPATALRSQRSITVWHEGLLGRRDCLVASHRTRRPSLQPVNAPRRVTNVPGYNS